MVVRISKLIISLIFYILNRIYNKFFLLLNNSFQNTIVVLMYHDVRKDSKIKFAKQMNLLVNIGQPIKTNFNIQLNKGAHHIAVTFDDGYENILLNALPVLRDKNIIISGFVFCQ